MKRISIYRKLLVVAGCVALVCATNVGVSLAATSESTAANGTVVTPIAIHKTTDLEFGTFAVSAAGTLSMTTAGVLSSAPLGAIKPMAGTPTAASFHITGEGGLAFGITMPAAGLKLSNGTPAEDMALVLTPNLAIDGTATLTGTGAAGQKDLLLSADLTVAAAQPAGLYTTTFTVSVDYN